MTQIVIQVKDEQKAKMLYELLMALDFVELIDTNANENTIPDVMPEEMPDFFSAAGLWEGREISLESIRQKAWPRQQ